MKASVFIATSFDGFIARPDGSIDWLPDPAAGTEDYGYAHFMASIDVIVMGRHSYEKVLTFGGDWPYDKAVVVLSSRRLEIPPVLASRVECMSGSPFDVVSRLEQRGARHLYVDGGLTIQRFLDAGLIQRLIVTRVPVLLGRGIPLFGPVARDIPLRHVVTRDYANGLVQSEYAVLARGATGLVDDHTAECFRRRGGPD